MPATIRDSVLADMASGPAPDAFGLSGTDATRAAYEVGYESTSQFSREYARIFGAPPRRDISEFRAAV